MTTPAPIHPLRAGLAAARVNLVPGLLLWLVASAIVLGYAFVPAVATAFTAIGFWKGELGLLFPLLSTALAGGLLPLLFQRLQGAGGYRQAWSALPFVVLFWGYKGVEIELLYRGQAWLFGDEATAAAILPKVLVDQFLYCPLWAVPSLIVIYAWHDQGYRPHAALAALGPHWYRRRVLPVLIANWAVWVPTVALIYALPQPLQLPMQNIILCLWVLILTVMIRPSPP